MNAKRQLIHDRLLLLPTNSPDYHLVVGHCTEHDCDHWATMRLIDEDGKRVPNGKMCLSCGQKLIRDIHIKIYLHWRLEPILMWHVGDRIFEDLEHAKVYALTAKVGEQTYDEKLWECVDRILR